MNIVVNPLYPFEPDPARGPFIRLYTGRVWHFLKPDPFAITIEDVAHHLSRKLRFAGAMDLTVAQHAVQVSLVVEQMVANREDARLAALTALHHDDEEAPLFDVPAPMKPALTGWPALEQSNRDAIFRGLGIAHFGWDVVKHVDRRIREDEVICCAGGMFRAHWTPEADPLGLTLDVWDMPRAKQAFINRHRKLLLVDLG